MRVKNRTDKISLSSRAVNNQKPSLFQNADSIIIANEDKIKDNRNTSDSFSLIDNLIK